MHLGVADGIVPGRLLAKEAQSSNGGRGSWPGFDTHACRAYVYAQAALYPRCVFLWPDSTCEDLNSATHLDGHYQLQRVEERVKATFTTTRPLLEIGKSSPSSVLFTLPQGFRLPSTFGGMRQAR